MGQAQSGEAAAIEEDTPKENENDNDNDNDNGNAPSSPPFQSLIQEATAYGSDGNESIDAEKALECPCIADLRKGPCGNQFSEAFLCFLKSTAEEKGSECVHPFVALQSCIKANPGAFSKDITGEEQVKNTEEGASGYQVHPPPWSLESRGPNSRL